MIKLCTYYCKKQPIIGEGTPGESIPRYDLMAVIFILREEDVASKKQEIENIHRENIRFTPWFRMYPNPKFYEIPYDITYEI